jgi:hypothetical protein
VSALVTAAVAATAVVLATTGHEHPATTPTSAKTPGGIAPILTRAAPPLLAAQATDDHRAPTHSRKTRAHASRHRHRSARSQRRTTHSSSGSSVAAAPRGAQPASATQPAVTTATASAATAASSAPVKRQLADTPSSGGGEFLP